MLDTRTRSEFLALTGTRSATLDQRVKVGEAAFALGVERPAHIGEYLLLDAVAMILASMINRFTGLELKRAADIVRTHWDDWLLLLTRAERFHSEQFVCIAWSLDRTAPPHVAMGEASDIDKALPAGETAPCLIPMRLLLRCLRGNAATAGIELPERLTIAPDEPGYAQWRRQIEDYQQAAGMRSAKAKLAPA